MGRTRLLAHTLKALPAAEEGQLMRQCFTEQEPLGSATLLQCGLLSRASWNRNVNTDRDGSQLLLRLVTASTLT